MRVPSVSVIHRLFEDKNENGRIAVENLKDWCFSSGETMAERVVLIQAQHHRDSENIDRIYAFVTIPRDEN